MLYYIFRFICNPQYVYYLLIYYYTFTFLYKSVSISLYLINYFTYFQSTYLYNSINKNIDNCDNNKKENDNDNNIDNDNSNCDNNIDNDNDNDKEITILLNNTDNTTKKNKFILL